LFWCAVGVYRWVASDEFADASDIGAFAWGAFRIEGG